MLRVPLIEEILGLDIAEHGKNTPKFEKGMRAGLMKSLSMRRPSELSSSRIKETSPKTPTEANGRLAKVSPMEIEGANDGGEKANPNSNRQLVSGGNV